MVDKNDTGERDGAANEESPSSGGGKKKLLGMVSGAVFLIGTSVAVGVLAFPDEEKKTESKEAVAVAEPKVVVFAPIPQILVNLADGGGIRLLQATMTLELETKDAAVAMARFTEILPKVQDRLIKILSSMSSTDVDGGTSKEFVQTRIKDHLNLGVVREEDFEVTDVFFTEFVIQ